jgi:hypothetical protein
MEALTLTRGRRAARLPHDRHTSDGRDVELEALAAVEARGIDDLDLDQVLAPITDAIDGLRSEYRVAPEFADLEVIGSRDGANLSSTTCSPAGRRRRR